jgi:hypothetical protein
LSEANAWQEKVEEAQDQVRFLSEQRAAQEKEIERLLEVEAGQEAGNDQTRKENFLKVRPARNETRAGGGSEILLTTR